MASTSESGAKVVSRCRLQFKRQLLKEEAALRIYDKATDGEAGTATVCHRQAACCKM